MTRVVSTVTTMMLLLEQIIVLSFVAVSVAAREACTPLPRIQVRFLCRDGGNFNANFNATNVMEEFYRASIRGHSDGNPNPYSLHSYVSVSISTVEDVDHRQWYYDRCDFSSKDSLVTIDSRTYFHWDEKDTSILVGNTTQANNTDDNSTKLQHPHHYDIPPFLIRQDLMRFHIESYFIMKVCKGGLHHFESKIEQWYENKYPIPTAASASAGETSTLLANLFDDDTVKVLNHHSQPDNDDIDRSCPALLLPPPLVKGGGQIDYPSSSIHKIVNVDGEDESSSSTKKKQHSKEFYYDLSEHRMKTDGYHYDHDLYLLCGGIHGAFDDAEDPSPIFVMICISAGYIMVYMIKAEYVRPLRYPELPRRTTARGIFHGIHRDRDSDIDDSDDNNSDGDDDDGENRGLTRGQNQREIELVTF